MYYEFIDLKDAPLSVKEIAENIHIVINGQIFVLSDRMDCKGIIDSFINRRHMIPVLTMESENKDTLLLFQMAVYRFYTVHIPIILEKIANKLKKLEDQYEARSISRRYSDCLNPADMEEGEKKGWAMLATFSSGLPKKINKNIVKWEREFWLRGKNINIECEYPYPRDTMYTYRKKLRKEKIAEKDSERGYDTMTVREVMDLAFQDKGTIEKVEELQQYYKPLKTKAKKLNMMLKNDGLRDELEKIRNMTKIVERGIQGELTAADVMELEENVQLWNASLQDFMNFYN